VHRWLALVLTLVACTDHGAASLTAIKNKVCACETPSCAEAELKRVPQDAIQSNHRTQAIARDMLDCLARLQTAERPKTDPDADHDDHDEGGPASGSGEITPVPGVAAPAPSAASPSAPAAAPAPAAPAKKS
jgi:hypothetical protein